MNLPRLTGNMPLYVHFCKTQKTLPIRTNRCSFQLKWAQEAHFHTKYDLQGQSFDKESLILLFKPILTCCKIWKLVLLNISVTLR